MLLGDTHYSIAPNYRIMFSSDSDSDDPEWVQIEPLSIVCVSFLCTFLFSSIPFPLNKGGWVFVLDVTGVLGKKHWHMVNVVKNVPGPSPFPVPLSHWHMVNVVKNVPGL